jgi:hypothetical protein
MSLLISDRALKTHSRPIKKIGRPSRLLQFHLLLLFYLFHVPSVAQESESSTKFVRFLNGDAEWQGQLQTAITSYKNSEGVTVELVSAIHIGDEFYYQELNDYFITKDAVLYELVANDNERPSPSDNIRSRSGLGFLQLVMAEFLQLSFQLEKIDYTPKNFRHADLNPAQLEETMEAKNENFFSMFISLAIAQIASDQAALAAGESVSSFNLFSIIRALAADDQVMAFKFLLAEELARGGGILVGQQLEQQLTILGDRNDAALGVLRQVLSENEAIESSNSPISNFSIFYGAAHMPGLERELIYSLGFELSSQRWLTAWRIQ